jgi:hypothetical protein
MDFFLNCTPSWDGQMPCNTYQVLILKLFFYFWIKESQTWIYITAKWYTVSVSLHSHFGLLYTLFHTLLNSHIHQGPVTGCFVSSCRWNWYEVKVMFRKGQLSWGIIMKLIWSIFHKYPHYFANILFSFIYKIIACQTLKKICTQHFVTSILFSYALKIFQTQDRRIENRILISSSFPGWHSLKILKIF